MHQLGKWYNTKMTINDETVKHEIKQYKPCPVRKNMWRKKWNNTNMHKNGELVKHKA
jgi:hypothetical protein